MFSDIGFSCLSFLLHIKEKIKWTEKGSRILKKDAHVYLLGKYYCLLLDYAFLGKRRKAISSNLFLSLLLFILSQYMHLQNGLDEYSAPKLRPELAL